MLDVWPNISGGSAAVSRTFALVSEKVEPKPDFLRNMFSELTRNGGETHFAIS
jgi:hypothetical protein